MPGPDFAQRVADEVGDRPVYIHLDCDVLEPGIVPTDYHVPRGLSLDDLHATTQALSHHTIVGAEIVELEDTSDPNPPDLEPLVSALSPLLEKLITP